MVYGERLFAAEITMGSDGMLGIEVDRRHERPRPVRTNGHQAQVKSTKVLARLVEMRAISCITGKVDPALGRVNHKSTPQSFHLTRQATSGPMANLDKRNCDAIDNDFIPPIKFLKAIQPD